jgi:hypothetical protein
MSYYAKNNINWGNIYLIDDVVDGVVDTYSELSGLTSIKEGDIFLVKTTTGIIGINRKTKGLYRYNGLGWDAMQTEMLGSLVAFNPTGTNITATSVEEAIKQINNKIGYWDSEP